MSLNASHPAMGSEQGGLAPPEADCHVRFSDSLIVSTS